MRQHITAWIAVLFAIAMPGHAQPAVAPDHPTIDIHAHTFNLRYLPVEGILDSYCVPPLLARSVSRALENLVVTDERPSKVLSFEAVKGILEKDPLNGDVRPWLDLLQKRIHEAGEQRRLERKKKRLVNYVEAVIEEERARERAETMALPRMPGTGEAGKEVREDEQPILDDYFFEQRAEEISEGSGPDFSPAGSPQAAASAAPLKALSSFSAIDLVIGILKKALGEKAPPAKFAGFLTILLLDEEDILRLMHWNYQDVPIFLSQMMDMEVAYGDRPVLPFDRQTERMSALSAKHDDLLWFGAYDPLRVQGLSLVEESLKRGAIGFKFYPPSGYRPDRNRIPAVAERGLCKFLSRWQIRRQHASRYDDLLRRSMNDPVKAGALLDKKIGEFLDLAQKERFAILSHHTPQGFESAKRYGLMMAPPCLWGEILKRRPDLLLILGHAGGGHTWFGSAGDTPGQDAAWDLAIEHPLDKTKRAFPFDRQAYNLCVAFPNVYCDLGYSMEVLDDGKRKDFEARLKRLSGDQALSREEVPESWDFCGTGDIPPRYDLREKILYGSDWMMPEATFVGEKYFAAFQKVFDGELEDYRHLFFGENARALLCRVKNPPPQLRCGEPLVAGKSPPLRIPD